MKHRCFSVTIVLFGILMHSRDCQCMPGTETSVQRPNILFIMSDDHTYQAVSAYGYGLNQTPHIDRLAREGGCEGTQDV